MKNILLVILFLLSVEVVSAQCLFSGRIYGYSFGTIYICEQFGDESKVVATVNTDANGEFSYQFTKEEIGLYRVHTSSNSNFDIIYNGENIRLQTNIKNLQSAMTVIESNENKQLYEYIANNEITAYKIQILQEFMRIYPDGKFLKTVEAELQNEIKNSQNLLEKAININPKSFAGRYLSYFRNVDVNITENQEKKSQYISRNFPMNDLELINSNAYHHFIISYLKRYEPTEYVNAVREVLDYLQVRNQEIFRKMFDYVLDGFESMQRYDDLYDLSIEYGNTCSSSEDNLSTRVKNYTQLRIGNHAPDFTIETLNKTQYTLSKMQTPYTLVIFWATWCDNCKAEIPQIVDVIPLLNRAGVNVVAISIDEDEKDIRNYIAENELPFTVACDYLGWQGSVVNDYAVFATPTMYIVDKNMKIVAKPATFEQLVNETEKLIK